MINTLLNMNNLFEPVVLTAIITGISGFYLAKINTKNDITKTTSEMLFKTINTQSEQIDKLTQKNEILIQKVDDLDAKINILKKENNDLKSKINEHTIEIENQKSVDTTSTSILKV